MNLELKTNSPKVEQTRLEVKIHIFGIQHELIDLKRAFWSRAFSCTGCFNALTLSCRERNGERGHAYGRGCDRFCCRGELHREEERKGIFRRKLECGRVSFDEGTACTLNISPNLT